MRSKEIILLPILVVIFLIILQQLQLLLKHTRESTSQIVEIEHLVGAYAGNCWNSTATVIYEIPECRDFTPGMSLLISGRVSPLSDYDKLSKKTLKVESIVAIKYSRLSFKYWVELATRSATKAAQSIAAVLERLLEEPSSGIVTATLFGGSWRLSDGAQSLFETIGIQHIAAASGFHLAIVMGFVQKVMSGLSRRTIAGVSIASAIAYYFLAAGTPSMLRACVVFSLVIMGRHLWWRPIRSRRLFLYGVAAILLINPEMAYSIGFQLSVAATAGIMFLAGESVLNSAIGTLFATSTSSSLFTIKEKKNDIQMYIIDTTRVSCIAQLAVTPLLLFHFGSVTLAGILATTVVSWLLPGLFLIATGTAILQVIVPVPFFGVPLSIAAALFWHLAALVEFLGPKLQFSYQATIPDVFLWYSLILVFAMALHRSRKPKRNALYVGC